MEKTRSVELTPISYRITPYIEKEIDALLENKGCPHTNRSEFLRAAAIREIRRLRTLLKPE